MNLIMHESHLPQFGYLAHSTSEPFSIQIPAGRHTTEEGFEPLSDSKVSLLSPNSLYPQSTF